MRQFLFAPEVTGPLGPVTRFIDTTIRWISAMILWVGFAALLTPTFLNATLRYTTDASLVGSEQVVQLVFPWFIMAGAVLAAQHGRHIAISLILHLVPGTIARGIVIAIQAVIFGASAIVVWFGFEVTMLERSTYFTLIGISQAWSYGALLVGYSLLAVTALTTIYRATRAEQRLPTTLGATSAS